MSHINFMTDRQKADMVYFKELTSNNSDNTETLYVVSSGNTLDEAIDNEGALRPRFLDAGGTYKGLPEKSILSL